MTTVILQGEQRRGSPARIFGFGAVLAVVLPMAEVVEVRDEGVRNYPGRIVPVAQVNVMPQVSGEILEVGFSNGQTVSTGDLLYRLDSVKYEAAVKNAEAKLIELRATLDYAEHSAKRHETLIKTRAVSQDDYDHALSARDAARASLTSAEADLVVARDDLKHCRIVAPISGKVGSTALTEGNYVQKGSVTLVTLVQTSPIRVRFSISNSDYHDLFKSDPVRIVRDGCVEVSQMVEGSDCTTGRVEYVENAADALTDTIEIYALLENAQGILKSGQTVKVTLRNVNGARRAAIPPNAVVQDLQGAFVWIVGGGGAVSKRRIVRGRMQDGLQIVNAGLKAGERIVSDGVHKVHEGAVVTAE